MAFIVGVTDSVWLWGLGLPVVAAIFRPLQRHPVNTMCVTLSESGQWHEYSEQPVASTTPKESWAVSRQSRLTPFALFVVLKGQCSHVTRFLWLWPDQVDDQHYRRIARAIYRQGLN